MSSADVEETPSAGFAVEIAASGATEVVSDSLLKLLVDLGFPLFP